MQIPPGNGRDFFSRITQGRPPAPATDMEGSMSEKKTYQIKTACPQCGCSAVSHLSAEEIREKFGDVPNVQMECSECMAQYEVAMKEACPEWAKDCKM